MDLWRGRDPAAPECRRLFRELQPEEPAARSQGRPDRAAAGSRRRPGALAHHVVRHDRPDLAGFRLRSRAFRSEEHTSELQSLMRISYAVFCLKKKTQTPKKILNHTL